MIIATCIVILIYLLLVKGLLFKGIKWIVILIAGISGIGLILSLCGCAKTYEVKAKQSNYSVMKVKREYEKCGLEQVKFNEEKGKMVLSDDDFDKLYKNIVKLNICYNTEKEKQENNLKYYEEIIEHLGGIFENNDNK